MIIIIKAKEWKGKIESFTPRMIFQNKNQLVQVINVILIQGNTVFRLKKENKSLIPPLVRVVKAWGTLKYVGSGGVREAIHTYI